MKDKLYTVPNMISLYRFLSALFILMAMIVDVNKWIVFTIYLIAVVTDKLDGVLARKLNQVSKTGELLETAVDTIFTGMILAYLVKRLDFPAMIFLGMFGLFLIAMINMTVYFVIKKKWYTRSLITSKISVVTTYAVAGLYFLNLSINEILSSVMLIVASVAFVNFQFNQVKSLIIKRKQHENISSNPSL